MSTLLCLVHTRRKRRRVKRNQTTPLPATSDHVPLSATNDHAPLPATSDHVPLSATNGHVPRDRDNSETSLVQSELFMNSMQQQQQQQQQPPPPPPPHHHHHHIISSFITEVMRILQQILFSKLCNKFHQNCRSFV